MCYFLIRMSRYQDVIDTIRKLEDVAKGHLADRGSHKCTKIRAHLYLTEGEFENAYALFSSVGLFNEKKDVNNYTIRQLMTMTKYHILIQDTKRAGDLIDVIDTKKDQIVAYRSQVELETYRCYLYYLKGNIDTALEALKEIIKRSFGLNIMLESIYCLELFALVLYRRKQYVKSATVYGKVKSLRDRYQLKPMKAIGEIIEIIESGTKKYLGRAFESFMEEGSKLSNDDVIEFVITA